MKCGTVSGIQSLGSGNAGLTNYYRAFGTPGIILLVLVMIGEYIGRIFMCINASPQYVERQVIRKRG